MSEGLLDGFGFAFNLVSGCLLACKLWMCIWLHVLNCYQLFWLGASELQDNELACVSWFLEVTFCSGDLGKVPFTLPVTDLKSTLCSALASASQWCRALIASVSSSPTLLSYRPALSGHRAMDVRERSDPRTWECLPCQCPGSCWHQVPSCVWAMHEQQCFMCKHLHFRLVVSFLWLRWRFSYLLQVNIPAHMCMYTYLCIHTHHAYMCCFLTPCEHTCACHWQRGDFSPGLWNLVGGQDSSLVVPSQLAPGSGRLRIRLFEVSGFHCFPCACFPAAPFCRYLCATIALGCGCGSPLSVGSKFSTAVFYPAWQVHLCSLWQGYVPVREGRGAFWLDQCHWKHRDFGCVLLVMVGGCLKNISAVNNLL